MKWQSRYLGSSRVLLSQACLNETTLPGRYQLHEHPAWWMLKATIEKLDWEPTT